MNSSTQLLDTIQADIDAVEQLMASQADGNHPDLRSAVSHILSSGGKRIRPAMTILMGRVLGANRDRCITLSSAIELLHTATLVHDDLIDGALLRRGIPTLNAQWTPGATVLTGDFVFAKAAQLAAATGSLPVMALFAQTLSTIVNGEITQLFTSRCNPSRSDYFERIYAKTSSLFETACASAAMLSDTDSSYTESARTFGRCIGMAFQIIDDILDFTGQQATLGKPIGSDLRQGLITLPTIIYIENHPELPIVQDLMAGNCLQHDPRLPDLVEAITNSDAPLLARDEASRWVKDGIAALHQLPASEDRDQLEALALQSTGRYA